jgi:Uma2 family endonuclease
MTIDLTDEPVGLPQARLLTVDEWVQHPAADRYELIDGLLRVRRADPVGHEFTVVRVASAVLNHLDRTGIRSIALASGARYRVRLRRGIMPDVSVVLGSKVEQIEPAAAFNTVGLDLAIEVLSPEQDEDYIEERLGDYWKLGTTEVWIVDPWARTEIGYARGEREFEVFARVQGEEEFSSRLLVGLSFSVQQLWMPERR